MNSPALARVPQEDPAGTVHLARIVEHSGDAIVGMDHEGNLTSWNRAAELMFGYSEAATGWTSYRRNAS